MTSYLSKIDSGTSFGPSSIKTTRYKEEDWSNVKINLQQLYINISYSYIYVTASVSCKLKTHSIGKYHKVNMASVQSYHHCTSLSADWKNLGHLWLVCGLRCKISSMANHNHKITTLSKHFSYHEWIMVNSLECHMALLQDKCEATNWKQQPLSSSCLREI